MTVETTYKCSKPTCAAEDHDRSPVGQKPPAALNCWRCKAGLGKALDEMLAAGIGMFPVNQAVSHA